jgi:hypothetical protein
MEEEKQPGNKNVFFNADEEARLDKHFLKSEMNQFFAIILEKVYENFPEIKVETWEKLMDILEKTYAKEAVKKQTAELPDVDKAILIANILYLILTTDVFSL